MSGLAWFGGILDLAAAATEFAAQWFIQSTLVIAAGLAVAAIVRKRNPALLSAVYHTTLVTALVCPLVAQGLSQAGLTFVAIKLPSVRSESFEMVPAPSESEPVAPPSSMPPLPLELAAEPGEPATAEIAPNQTGAEIASPRPGSFSQSAVTPPVEAAPQTQAVTTPSAPLVSPAPAVLMVRRMVVSTRPYVAALFLGVPLVWGVVSLVLLTRLLVDHWQIARLRRKAEPVDAETLCLCEATARRMQVPMPRLLRTPLVTSPCLSGILRPVILLPEEIDPSALPSVLVHELAHHKRGDCFWNLLRHVGAALLWPQPLIWKLARQMEAAAEDVCDDYVVQYGQCRVSYAETLLAIAERNLLPAGEAAVSLVTFRSLLGQRVSRILDPTRRLSLTIGLTALLLVAAGGASAALLAGMLGPERREAAAPPVNDDEEKLDEDAKGDKSSDAKTADVNEVRREILGRVLTPDGKPAAGASVVLMARRRANIVGGSLDHSEETEIIHQTTAGADGQFTLESAQLAENSYLWSYVVAKLPQSGLGWKNTLEFGDDPTTSLMLSEPRELRGQLVTAEGTAAAGIRVRVAMLGTSKLGSFAGIDWVGAGVAPTVLPAEVTTDEKGWYAVPQLPQGADVLFAIDQEPYAPRWWMRKVEVGTDPVEVLDPAQVITGVVVEADTGKPIPFARLTAFQDRRPQGMAGVDGQADAAGRFRLNPHPAEAYTVSAFAPADSPYLARDVKFEWPATATEHELRLEMPRGVLVRGQVTEQESGKPVAAAGIRYEARSNNRFATDDLKSGWNATRVADADGRYSIAVPAGQGSLRVICADGQHVAEEIPRRLLLDGNAGGERIYAHALASFDLAADAKEHAQNFLVERGKTVRAQVFAPDGQPAKRLVVAYAGCALPFHETYFHHAQPIEGNLLQIGSIPPTGELQIYLLDPISKAGRVVTLRGEDAERTHRIDLLPCGSARQRVVDPQGRPVPDARSWWGLHIVFRPGIPWSERDKNKPTSSETFVSNFDRTNHWELKSDSDGWVNYEALIPGVEYQLHGSSSDGKPEIQPIGEVKSGEQLQLADHVVRNQDILDAAERTREEMAKKEAAAAAGTSPTPADDDLVTVSGTVLDPSGKTVAGAAVAAVRWYWGLDDPHEPLAETTTDDSGRFTISYRKSQFGKNFGRPEQWREAAIVATQPGLGPDWTYYHDIPANEPVELRLVEDHPIKARIVDLEGQPVVGASIRVESVYRNEKEELSRWIEAVRSGIPYFGSQDYDRPDDSLYVTGLPLGKLILTDEQGRFEIPGVGRNRNVNFQLSGGGVAVASLRAVSMPEESFVVDFGQGPFKNLTTYFGSQFEFSAEPSQPVEGIVRDAKTGQPLAGVRVVADKLAGGKLSGIYAAVSTSDAAGRYRLEGLPKGTGNGILAMPGDDLPYFMREFRDVPTSPGLTPVNFDLDLHRGIWVTGRMREKESNKPVRARMFYLPWPGNPHISGLPEFNSGHLHGSQSRYETDLDGRFRLVGLPGRALLGAVCVDRPYPTGQGVREIADLPPREVYNKVVGVFAPTDLHPTAVHPIHPADNAEQIEVDFQIDAGKSLRLQIVDGSGQPVSGVFTNGLWPKAISRGPKSIGPAAEMMALKPDERRLVLLHHAERQLGKAIELGLADAKDGEVSVALERCAVLKVRLVNEYHEPVVGAQIHCRPVGEADFGLQLPTVVTDANGVVNMPALLPGCKYDIGAESPQIGQQTLAEELEVAAGETIDLGEFDPKKEKRPPIKRTPAGDVAQSALSAAEQMVIRGVVVDEEDKPIAGASVRFIRGARAYWPNDNPQLYVTTDEQGRFAFTLPPGVSVADGKPWPVSGFITKKDGYGLNRYMYGADRAGTEATIQLKRQSPIEGRIVNLEGQPMPGVQVEVEGISVNPTEDLTAWIDAVRKGLSDAEMEPAWKPNYGFGDSINRAAHMTQTDADGRFRVLGVAPHQLVLLKVAGGGIVGSRIEVVNVPIDPLPNPKSPPYAPMIYGSKFQLIAEPSQLIEGIVKDAGTGAPVAGIKVTSWKMAGTNVGGIDLIESISDAEGRYRLDGMPRGEGNVIVATPTGEQPYLAREIEVPAGRELEAIQFDLPLHRGVLIRGRLRDKATGEPLLGSVIYLPWPSNPRIEGLPEFSSRQLMGDQEYYNTNKEGQFRVVGLPGRGLLSVRMLAKKDYPVGQGFDKLRDPIDKDAFKSITQLFTPDPMHTLAIQDVEIADDATEFEAKLELQSVNSVQLVAVDSAGQPVEMTHAVGLETGNWGNPRRTEGHELQVTGLAEGERRQVTLSNADKGWGASVEVTRTDGTTDRRVAIQPMATIVGRLLNKDGEPMHLSPLIVTSVDKNRPYRTEDVITDRDGRFKVMLVAAPFGYRVFTPNIRGNLAEDLKVAPGETIDLGTITSGAERPPIKRTPATTAAASSTTTAQTDAATISTPSVSSTKDDPDTFHFTGNVIDPAGNPVAGANILVSCYTTAPLNTLPRATTTPSAVSQTDGTFAFSMRKDEFDTTNMSFPWEGAHLVAQKAGWGLGWSHVAANDTSGKIREAVWSKSRQQTPELREKLTDSTIRLVADDVPIEGRIVDLEGQPIPGTVVRVVELHANRANNLDAWQKVAENKRADYYAALATLPDGFHGFFLQEQLESLLPAVTADADGRFRINGVGRERIVKLQIEPPGFETRQVFSRTRPGQTYEISQHADRPDWRKLAYHGSNFTHVAAPSQPLVGVVRDKDTGKPLANVSIRAYSLAGEEISGWSNGYIRTVTDAEGRYELKGLPIGENHVISRAPLSEPYLCINSRFEIAAVKPTTLDIALKRGVWIRGQVTDADSGAPLRGRIEYFVFNDNPHRKPAGELLRIEDPFYNTGADGKFSVVGLPGRGLISFMTQGVDNIYPRGSGADKIIGGRDEGQPMVFDTSPHFAFEGNAHAFVEVNPRESDEAIEANIQLSAGTKIVGTVLDPAGQPLPGCQYSGQIAMAWFQTINTSEFTVRHLKSGEKRRVLFYHPEQNLAGSLAVDGGDIGPLSVRLEPAGSVHGRIVDDAGLPIADAQIYTGQAKDDVGAGANVFPDTQKIFTDDDGRFTLKGLAPGVKYSARSGRHGRYLGTIFQNVSVSSRETKDLGDLNPKSDAELAKGESPEAAKATPVSEPGDKAQLEFAGKVLDPDGKPKAGAKVVLVYSKDSLRHLRDATPPVLSGADGAFTLTLSADEIHVEDVRLDMLVATAEGAGVAWEHAAAFESSGRMRKSLTDRPEFKDMFRLADDRTLRLVKDVPINGRIVDLEGQGVAGATIRIAGVNRHQAEGPQTWLLPDESGRVAFGRAHSWSDVVRPADLGSSELLAPVTTDAEGRFQIVGLGRERLVSLSVAAKGIQTAPIDVLTRTADALPLGDAVGGEQAIKPINRIAEFDFAVAPSRPVVGTVRDVDSGQPIAGVRVMASNAASVARSHELAVTDSEGRYHLEGLPIGKNELAAVPPLDQPYLPVQLKTETDPQQESATLDFQLKRGVWIRGQVTDGDTGKPIAHARMSYLPFGDNPNSRVGTPLLVGNDGTRADREGRFQVAGLAGHGLLTVTATDKYPRGAGKELVATPPNGLLLTYPIHTAPDNVHYLAELNIDAANLGGGQHDIVLHAGSRRSGTVLDADGSPLTGAFAVGLKVAWESLETSDFEIQHLERGSKRRLYFYHAPRQLAASIEVSGDDTEPVVVKLQPAGTIRGRILLNEGEPAANVKLSSGPRPAGSSPRGVLPPRVLPEMQAGKPLWTVHQATDGDGRFAISGLVPGDVYSLRVIRGSDLLGTAFENVAIAPGETKDLGELTIVTPQD